MYHIVLDGNQTGPFSLEQVQAYWKEGRVDGTTLFWQEGQADWQPLETIHALLEPSLPPVPTAPIISGFWRRLGAYLIDLLILGIPGLILGFFLFQFFCDLGPWGLLIGLAVCIPYFGLLNSTLGHGQTLGKRLLKIQVVDAKGNFISPGRAILRYLIFAAGFYLNAVVTSTGMASTSPMAIALTTVVAALGGTITYLAIFNRRNRENLHDLVFGTYVVRAPSEGPVVARELWPGHRFVLGGYILLLIGAIFISYAFLELTPLKKIVPLQDALMRTGKVRSAFVTEGEIAVKKSGTTRSSRIFSVKLKWKGEPENTTVALREIAALVFKEYPDVRKDNLMSIEIDHGYNIGISWSYIHAEESYGPDEWEKMVRESGLSK